jgi:transcriptional regulator with XRE-family HTH domain
MKSEITQGEPMSVISKRFADELAAEKAMRDAYLSAQTRTKLSNQIRAIRTQRGWSQGEFAKRLQKPQSNVSRIESREYGSFTLKTLLELANAFDCGLLVEFVSYYEFLIRTQDLSPKRLQVSRFTRQELDPLCRDIGFIQTSDIIASITDSIANLSKVISRWTGSSSREIYLSKTTNPPLQVVPEQAIASYLLPAVSASIQSMATPGPVGPAMTITTQSIPMTEINAIERYGMAWVGSSLSKSIGKVPWTLSSNALVGPSVGGEHV